MATVAELKAVLKDTLEKRGALGQIKARIRAEVFNALDDQSEPRPPLSHENLLINELIREYLEYNKYKYAASVLTAALLAALSQIKKTYPLLLILENLASLKCLWIDSFLPKN
ncbi:centrosomal protein 20 isoform X3 [Aquila chrysaetos chrysaetos]|uniref:centrosomal protein 20 isoform X3 n=1 Tax=Aquila chrysaetos chrysaetos TaxID=223781 RepID=UPI001B7D45D8|nr:centrosomal protein 20 isoform X3 [Aquila chrysaetos chrysaetos]